MRFAMFGIFCNNFSLQSMLVYSVAYKECVLHYNLTIDINI